MSILNVFAGPDTARVYCDTWSRRIDEEGLKAGVAGHACKMVPLVASNSVLAFRGHGGFGITAAKHFLSIFQGEFDLIARPAAQVLDLAWTEYERDNAALGVTPAHKAQQEIILVGWSRYAGRTDFALFMTETEEGGAFTDWESANQENQWAVLPWTEQWGPLPAVAMQDDHLALARQQVRRVKEDGQPVAIGGRLLCAEITKDGMRTFDVGEL